MLSTNEIILVFLCVIWIVHLQPVKNAFLVVLVKVQLKYQLHNLLQFVKGPAETSISPPATADKQNPLKSTTSNKHIIAEDAIVMQKKLGSGEFGVVQQGVWTSERGEKVSWTKFKQR